MKYNYNSTSTVTDDRGRHRKCDISDVLGVFLSMPTNSERLADLWKYDCIEDIEKYPNNDTLTVGEEIVLNVVQAARSGNLEAAGIIFKALQEQRK